jgi:hypothetical protein
MDELRHWKDRALKAELFARMVNDETRHLLNHFMNLQISENSPMYKKMDYALEAKWFLPRIKQMRDTAFAMQFLNEKT